MENHAGKSLILGLWKFAEGVAIEELRELAKEWAKDDNYLELYIRQVSKDQLGIGFAHYSDGTRNYHMKYFDDVSDALKRKFGNSWVGWDMATTDDLIKGF